MSSETVKKDLARRVRESIRNPDGNYTLPEDMFELGKKFGFDPVDVVFPVIAREAKGLTRLEYYTSFITEAFNRMMPVENECTVIEPEKLFAGMPENEIFRFAKDVQNMDSAVFQKTLDEIVPTTTYFFRDMAQFDFFAQIALPDIVRFHRDMGENRIRIWSIGCSYGAEPYGLAIMMLENQHIWRGFDVEIIGTDINKKALEGARAGVFTDDHLKHVSAGLLAKYFKYNQNDKTHLIRDDVKRIVDIRFGNLLDQSHLKSMVGFDTIVCKNTANKFNYDITCALMSHIELESLVEGGFLFYDFKPENARQFNIYDVYCQSDNLTKGWCYNGHPEKYSLSHVAQRKGNSVGIHTNFPGNQADISPEDKLYDSFGERTPKPAVEKKVFEYFGEVISHYTDVQKRGISFNHTGEFIRLYFDANPMKAAHYLDAQVGSVHRN